MVKREPYDPIDYWQKRGEFYTSDASNIIEPLDVILDFAKANCESLLDIGSGWGRVFNYFKSNGYTGVYDMCDIAQSMIEACQRETGVKPQRWGGKKLPYESKIYDAALLIHVLQHSRTPDVILKEAARVSKKFVVVLDNTAVDKAMSSHCFHHDWFLLFARCDLKIRHCSVYKSGSVALWIMEKE